jgi:hypothetical protein
MDSDTERPLRLFFNPFALWTHLAFKTGQAMWNSAHAATVRSNTAPNVAVIPTADAPSLDAQQAAKPADETLAPAHAEAPRNPKVTAPPAARSPRKAQATVRPPAKAVRLKATRAKLRSKANAKRRTKR